MKLYPVKNKETLNCFTRYYLIVYFLLGFCLIKAQSESNSELQKTNSLLISADSLLSSNPVEAKKMAIKAMELSQHIKNDSLLYKARFFKGVANAYMGMLNEALEDFITNKQLAIKLKNNVSLLESVNAIGNTYKEIERYDMALNSYKEALDICEKNGLSAKTYLMLSNIAIVYNLLHRPDTSNIICFDILKRYQTNHKKDDLFLSNLYSTILSNFTELNAKDSVEKYSPLALELKLKLGDQVGYAGNLNNIGQFYYKIGDYTKAESCLRKALATKTDNLQLTAELKQSLANTLIKVKKHEEAAILFREYISLYDSINEIQTVDKLSEMEVKYETGKKEEELKRLSAEQEINNLKVKQSKIYTLISVLSVIVFVIIAGVLYKQNKNKKEANKLLQTQNNEILHQKKEITDSINYAKRIQLAILPPDKMVKRLLPDAFIYYKPKDVVSGDFYWVEEKNGLIMFAAVDCTGHGVPGAMMSVVGLNLLNRAVNEKDLTRPSDILQHLDMGVTDTLRQNQADDTIKDGMDLSLCTYNPKTMELQYAGAFNNLWVVRKKFSTTHTVNPLHEVLFEDCLLEVKADKFPIGSNTDGVADTYTNHKLQLQKGDCIYLYSDGYADQFGGPKGKKFKYNALKKLLISICHLSPSQQREELNKTYEHWRGNLEQIDDVLVIGVCI